MKLTLRRIEELENMISDKYKFVHERKDTDIIEILIDRLSEKKSQIQKNFRNRFSLNIFDLETVVLLMLRKICLDNRQVNPFFVLIREQFQKKGIDLILYYNDQYEYHSQKIISDIVLIGLPGSHLDIPTFYPLIFHELGHYYFVEKIFAIYTTQATKEIEEWKIDNSSSTVGLRDERVFHSYRDMKYYLEYWPKEIFCDLFSTFICRSAYLKAFAIYQSDKDPSNSHENYPPNEIRLKILLHYLKKSGCVIKDEALSEFQTVFAQDNDLSHLTLILFSEELIITLLNGFNSFVENNGVIRHLRDCFYEFEGEECEEEKGL